MLLDVQQWEIAIMRSKLTILVGVVALSGCAHQVLVLQANPELHASSAIVGKRGPSDPRRYHSYVAIAAVDGVDYDDFGQSLPDAVTLTPGKHHVALKCFGATSQMVDVDHRVEQDIEIAPDTLYGVDVKVWIPLQDSTGTMSYPHYYAGACAVDIVETARLAENADLESVVMKEFQRMERENAAIPIRFGYDSGVLP